MNTKKKTTCPEIHLLEAYINKCSIPLSIKNVISKHLTLCPQCKIKASELKRFYSIFEEESILPISGSVFKLINEVEHGKIAITNILLQPVEPLNGHISMPFKSKLVFSTQNFDQKNLVDVNYIPAEDSDILIRVVQSLSTQETTFYLFSHLKRLYCNIRLQLDSSKKRYESDCCGKIELGKFDIRSLDNKIITVTVEE